MPLPIPQDLAGTPADAIDAIAKQKGQAFATSIKTNQIRNVFAAVSSIRQQFKQTGNCTPEIERSLILLKPKLAYAAGRQTVVRPFQEFMSQAIDAVKNSKNKKDALENFFALVESVVAYHKFYGGKDN
jgi:CRISPR-associated protein Csm2